MQSLRILIMFFNNLTLPSTLHLRLSDTEPFSTTIRLLIPITKFTYAAHLVTLPVSTIFMTTKNMPFKQDGIWKFIDFIGELEKYILNSTVISIWNVTSCRLPWNCNGHSDCRAKSCETLWMLCDDFKVCVGRLSPHPCYEGQRGFFTLLESSK